MRRTKEEIKMKFRGKDIIIPKGTATNNETACGIDKNYNFICEFGWIAKDMPISKYDAVHYGINIPADLLED